MWARSNTFCSLYAHSLVWCTGNTFMYVKAILFGLLSICTEYFPLYLLAVINESYLFWMWTLEYRLQSQSLHRTLLSIFRITDGDLPELVILCRSIQYATVLIYRTLTTLLQEMYMSRHPHSICFVILICVFNFPIESHCPQFKYFIIKFHGNKFPSQVSGNW